MLQIWRILSFLGVRYLLAVASSKFREMKRVWTPYKIILIMSTAKEEKEPLLGPSNREHVIEITMSKSSSMSRSTQNARRGRVALIGALRKWWSVSKLWFVGKPSNLSCPLSRLIFSNFLNCRHRPFTHTFIFLLSINQVTNGWKPVLMPQQPSRSPFSRQSFF